LSWGGHCLDLHKRTHIMAVLNVTPDSFSDGGRYFQHDRALARGHEMAREGADIIDVGGESTRPYSKTLSIAEEMDRVMPVVEALSQDLSVPVSIDTTKSEVAREAVRVGASMINDISALRFDPLMAETAARAGVPVILMHMRGTPGTMQDNPTYDDLLGEIIGFLKDAVDRSVRAGIREDLIVLDPGIGFGKTFDHNLQIIKELSRLQALGKPILIGTSNKAFIGHILDKEPHERSTGTMATLACAVLNGANIVRVHDVPKAVETVKIADAIKRGRVI
jgi:dihydropteroate synthase